MPKPTKEPEEDPEEAEGHADTEDSVPRLFALAFFWVHLLALVPLSYGIRSHLFGHCLVP